MCGVGPEPPCEIDPLNRPGLSEGRAARTVPESTRTVPESISVLEALRIGAARVLDMHLDDLQTLVIGHVERAGVDALLWDPMPGGSGLLDHLCERFGEVAQAAREVVDDCPSVCASSCIDCLRTFRNAYYHRYLDRTAAASASTNGGGFSLPVTRSRRASRPPQPPPRARRRCESRRLPPAGRITAAPRTEAMPVNDAERKLRHLLLAAGFAEGIRGEQIRLGRAFGAATTTSDVIYRTEDHEPDEGVCIYPDGLSRHLHGNPETAERDRSIRAWLRSRGCEVVEIPAHDLDDEEAMVRHFRRLAGYLGMREPRNRVSDDRSWFHGREEQGAAQSHRLPDPAGPGPRARIDSIAK